MPENYQLQISGSIIMIWGMILWHSLSVFSIMDGSVDQFKCMLILANHVHPCMQIAFPEHLLA